MSAGAKRGVSAAAKVVAVITGLVGLDLVLYYLAATYQLYIPPFRWLYDWGAQYGLDQLFNPANILTLLELAWAVYIGWRVVRLAQTRKQEANAPGKATDLKAYDVGLDELLGPRHPPADPSKLTEDDIDQIIVRWRDRRQKAWYVFRTLALCALAVAVVLTVINLGAVIGIVIGLAFSLQLIVLLHQQYPILMAEIYMTVAACFLIIWAIPYRMSRKVLKVTQEGHTNILGRVVFIRGCDSDGNFTPGVVYGMWYALHYFTSVLRGHRKEWEDVKPSPHEVPMGTPFYLLGNKDTRHDVGRFQHEIIYQDNTRGWLDRRLHPTPLWTNSNVEVSAWGVSLIGDGANMLAVPRKGYDSIAHRELTMDALTEHERKVKPYQDRMLDTLVSSKTLVAHGVRSDPSLGKEAVHRFVLPSHDMILGKSPSQVAPEAPKPPLLPGSTKDKKSKAGKGT